MNTKKNCFTVFIVIILIAVSVATFSDAQPIAKLSTPEVTIKLVNHSYEVAPTSSSSTYPYNNKTTTITTPGYHVQNFTIDLTVKNQPIPSSIDGNTSYLLYDIRTKGHYGKDWIENNPAVHNAVQSTSEYTVISLPANYAIGDEVDFQVRAILAYGYNFSLCATLPVYSYDYINVALSDWSPTQTFRMPDTSNLATPSSTETNSKFSELQGDMIPIFLGVIIFLALAVVAALIYKTRQKSRSTSSSVSF
jgi:hypothetical protein